MVNSYCGAGRAAEEILFKDSGIAIQTLSGKGPLEGRYKESLAALEWEPSSLGKYCWKAEGQSTNVGLNWATLYSAKEKWTIDIFGVDEFTPFVERLKMLDRTLTAVFTTKETEKTNEELIGIDVSEPEPAFDLSETLPVSNTTRVWSAIAFVEDVCMAPPAGKEIIQTNPQSMPQFLYKIDPTPRPDQIQTIGDEDSDLEELTAEEAAELVDPAAGVVLRELRAEKKKKIPTPTSTPQVIAATTTSTSAASTSTSAAPPAAQIPKKKLTPEQQALATRNAKMEVISLRVIDEMFQVRPPPAIVKQQPSKTSATSATASASSTSAIGKGICGRDSLCLQNLIQKKSDATDSAETQLL